MVGEGDMACWDYWQVYSVKSDQLIHWVNLQHIMVHQIIEDDFIF